MPSLTACPAATQRPIALVYVMRLMLVVVGVWIGSDPAGAAEPPAVEPPRLLTPQRSLLLAKQAVADFYKNSAGAADALASAAHENPTIATALWTIESQARLAAGQKALAAVVALRVVEIDPRWAGRAAWTAALAMGAQDCRAALDLFERVPADPPWVSAAERLMQMWSLQAQCQDPQAATTRQRLAVAHPETPQGQKATEGLALSASERLERAASYERSQRYQQAASELTGLLSSPVADEARFQLGRLHLERVREDFRVAERAFAQLVGRPNPHQEEAAFLRARARGRAGDVPGAIAAYRQYLKRWPKGQWTYEAWFSISFLDYERRRYQSAAKGFARLVARGRKRSGQRRTVVPRRARKWVRAAGWYHAWSLYLAGSPRADKALLTLARRAPPTSAAARRATYWAARALEPRDAAAARTMFVGLVEDNPMDWYALLIRRRDETIPRPPAPVVDAAVAAPPMSAAMAAAVQEVRDLHEVGLTAFAQRAWVSLETQAPWSVQHDLALAINDFEWLHRRGALRIGWPPSAFPPPSRIADWQAVFPTPWLDIVGPTSARLGVRPAWIYSLMLKESAFDPDAVSRAHAMGLLQLLSRTARRILDARGEHAQPLPNLFDPATNIDLATWYVGGLARRYHRQLPLVAAAYNAGPPAVSEWIRGREQVPTDLFVDTIPFREARRYVKRVVEIRHVYRWVQPGLDVEPVDLSDMLPLTLDLTDAPGVDF